MRDFYLNILETIVGGLFLTFILFLLNEFVFIKPNFTGEWNTFILITDTQHIKFQQLSICFKIHLLQKGYELVGSGEKISEKNKEGEETVFEREKRVIVNIEGYVERKFLRKSVIYLNVQEEGRIRESRSTYVMKTAMVGNLKGKFSSTAADASGIVEMVKNDRII